MPESRRVAIMPSSHLDLFWLGDYRNCLRRGEEIMRSYIDRAVESGDETFVIDTAIFAEHFLRENPDYVDAARRLVREGRLEIGSAYIDRWENLVLGESLIRNIQIGRAVVREWFGNEPRLAAHPDLPGLNAQTSQIYAQAGIRYYATSRKIFQEGRIWRHRSPEGTALTMITWPVHYVFIPLDEQGVDADGNGNFCGPRTLSYDDVAGRYPHGTIAMSGSAGDLTTAADFTTRYGRDMREYIGRYRERHPELEIEFSIPARELAPYLTDEATPLAEVSGSIPSVWGVAPDEEMRFFHRVRALEALLLDGETASVLGALAGRSPLPESARRWRGLYGEDAFFADDDLAPEGREWEWLWRMQVFTQDHNGGGQDGVLSVFQKKVRHDRARGYALEVLDHALGRGDGAAPAVLRTRLGVADDRVVLDSDLTAELAGWLSEQPAGAVQAFAAADGTRRAAIRLAPETGVGFGPLRLAADGDAVSAAQTGAAIHIHSGAVEVAIDRTLGTVTVQDRARATTWRVPVGSSYAVRELGNDVTLSTDETQRVDARVLSVQLTDDGPLVARTVISWELLDVVFTTTVSVWAGEARIDLETEVDWPGFERWQVRMPLTACNRADVTFGTPFHFSGWEDFDSRVNTLMPDEISMDDLRSYREVQHWVHVAGRNAGLAVLTSHPAFRHAGDELEAVLLRTAPSCGDPRMMWENAGRTTWSFRLEPTEAEDPASGRIAERADRAWRAPRILPDAVASAEHVDALANHGDPVRLSAMYLDGSQMVVRLVNQSAAPATALLSGAVVTGAVSLADLSGKTWGTIEPNDGVLAVTLAPWRIQDLRFDADPAVMKGLK